MIYYLMIGKKPTPPTYTMPNDDDMDCEKEAPPLTPKERKIQKAQDKARMRTVDERRAKRMSSRILIDELRSRGFSVGGGGKT